jgi:hypothetical protein
MRKSMIAIGSPPRSQRSLRRRAWSRLASAPLWPPTFAGNVERKLSNPVAHLRSHAIIPLSSETGRPPQRPDVLRGSPAVSDASHSHRGCGATLCSMWHGREMKNFRRRSRMTRSLRSPRRHGAIPNVGKIGSESGQPSNRRRPGCPFALAVLEGIQWPRSNLYGNEHHGEHAALCRQHSELTHRSERRPVRS